jgi:3-dehydroquinate dehydratase-2|tara:strand:+ start:114 stop:542 length:429 start_codon:yes stop_codon:yes gene_type:complete
VSNILVIHGAGIDMRGKTQVDIFGSETMSDYNSAIIKYAEQLEFTVDIFHSNIEGEIINKIYEAQNKGCHAAIINPAGFSIGYPALCAAISQVEYPTIEVHISNPAKRGQTSDISTVCKGSVTGLGLQGYYVAMRAISDIIS